MSVTYVFDNSLPVTGNEIISGRDLVPLLLEYSKDKDEIVGLEIGLGDGPTAGWLLQNLSKLRHYGIDPYVPYQDWYPEGYLDQFDRNRHKERMNMRTSKYGARFTHYQMTSDEAVSNFEDNTLDFIFIDGLHEYGQVLTDCRNYYSKVKSGGIFSGHDYKVIAGVGKAVDEFAAEVGATVNYLPGNDVWYWIKP